MKPTLSRSSILVAIACSLLTCFSSSSSPLLHLLHLESTVPSFCRILKQITESGSTSEDEYSPCQPAFNGGARSGFQPEPEAAGPAAPNPKPSAADKQPPPRTLGATGFGPAQPTGLARDGHRRRVLRGQRAPRRCGGEGSNRLAEGSLGCGSQSARGGRGGEGRDAAVRARVRHLPLPVCVQLEANEPSFGGEGRFIQNIRALGGQNGA